MELLPVPLALKKLMRVTLIVCAFALVAGPALAAQSTWPRAAYFAGIENRVAEADAIVAGRVQLLESKEIGHSSEYAVKAVVKIEKVLVGDHGLREITFSTRHLPGGLTAFAGEQGYGAEDTRQKLLIHMLEYEASPRVVVFAKRGTNGWNVFYCFRENERDSCAKGISRIIEAERLGDNPLREVLLSQMLEAAEEDFVKKYAIRSELKSASSWEDKLAFVQKHVTNGTNAQLSGYAVNCLTSHLFSGYVPPQDAGKVMDILGNLVQSAPDAATLGSSVAGLRRVSDLIRTHTEEAARIRGALAGRFAVIGGDSSQASKYLERAIPELLHSLDQPK